MSVSSGRVSLPPSTSEGDENSEDEAMGGISDNGGEAAERRGLRDVQVKSASSSFEFQGCFSRKDCSHHLRQQLYPTHQARPLSWSI